MCVWFNYDFIFVYTTYGINNNAHVIWPACIGIIQVQFGTATLLLSLSYSSGKSVYSCTLAIDQHCSTHRTVMISQPACVTVPYSINILGQCITNAISLIGTMHVAYVGPMQVWTLVQHLSNVNWPINIGPMLYQLKMPMQKKTTDHCRLHNVTH